MRANPEIDALLHELLDSGISPKYVSRLAAELEDHYADLEAEATRLGVPECESAEDARVRLGNSSVIAKEFALRPELKSWVYRSRCLERLLRALVAAYLLVRTPARLVAAGQTVMLRYTAATAAGASVTCCILLLLTALMPPSSNWGARFVEQAGAALGAWELERPRRYRPVDARRGGAGNPQGVPSSGASAAPTPAPDDAPADREPAEPTAAQRDADDARFALERPSVVRVPLIRRPEMPPRVLDLHTSARASFESSARVILADAEPSISLVQYERARESLMRELRPVVKVAPVYPLAAVQRGIEGHVVLEYTVTRNGTVADPVIVESSHPLLNRAALDAAREFKYMPRIIRGEAVEVSGVRIMFRFELEA